MPTRLANAAHRAAAIHLLAGRCQVCDAVAASVNAGMASVARATAMASVSIVLSV
jgi:hypothetical protein